MHGVFIGIGIALSILAVLSFCGGLYLRMERKNSSKHRSGTIGDAFSQGMEDVSGLIEIFCFVISLFSVIIALHCFGIW